ncbi:hypothetical protein KC726_04435 [Candidatus Woesebacteria bacterium]|nr:hypothetical protein [Candidatus Woesebacteria bacterium]
MGFVGGACTGHVGVGVFVAPGGGVFVGGGTGVFVAPGGGVLLGVGVLTGVFVGITQVHAGAFRGHCVLVHSLPYP